MLEKFERYRLTFGPTPIERLKRLSAHLGGEVELYAKREDCNSGLAFGGNKLRKLEYIIPDALRSNADTLVTIGGVQSNHTRQVAAVAAKIGMKCRLVQEAWVPHEDAVYDRVGNIMLSRIMGADVRLVDDGFDIGIRRSWEDALKDVEAQGGRPYAIPAGASVHKYGGLGYVGFAEEVRAGARTWVCVRLHYRVHGDGLDPRRHGRGLRQGRAAAQGDRHRRLRDAKTDKSAGARYRPQHGETDRTRAGRRRRRRGAD
jgi:1-aminocyclopropane-1-carboxylate deaminase